MSQAHTTDLIEANTNIVLHLSRPGSKSYLQRLADYLSEKTGAPYFSEAINNPLVGVVYIPTAFHNEQELQSEFLLVERSMDALLKNFPRTPQDPTVFVFSVLRGDMSEWEVSNPIEGARKEFEDAIATKHSSERKNGVKQAMAAITWSLMQAGMRDQNPLLYRAIIDSRYREEVLSMNKQVEADDEETALSEEIFTFSG